MFFFPDADNPMKSPEALRRQSEYINNTFYITKYLNNIKIHVRTFVVSIW